MLDRLYMAGIAQLLCTPETLTCVVGRSGERGVEACCARIAMSILAMNRRGVNATKVPDTR